MLKVLILSLLLSASLASASDPQAKEDAIGPKRTGYDLAVMLAAVLGPKVLGLDKNLIAANIEWSELQEEIERAEKKSIEARNKRIEAEMNRYDDGIKTRKLKAAEVERYRKRNRLTANIIRGLGVGAALDFFIFDNASTDTDLLRNTTPSTVNSTDPVPVIATAEK